MNSYDTEREDMHKVNYVADLHAERISHKKANIDIDQEGNIIGLS